MVDLWEFWIDVGGTFTDCVARSPRGELTTVKLLSSSVTKGRVHAVDPGRLIGVPALAADPPGFWNGASIRFFSPDSQVLFRSRVEESLGNPLTTLLCESLPEWIQHGVTFELDTGEEAPVLAIRQVLGLRPGHSFPRMIVKLGTTRGTNALLTRRGARTAFITTRGFADVLLIANQDRPRLFDLAIRKPEPLFESVVEIDARMDAQGNELTAPDRDVIRRDLEKLRATGVESIAICLLHAFADGRHERLVEEIARQVGFTEISTSSRLSPLIRIVSRGDTTVVDAYLNPVLRDYVERIRRQLGDGCTLKMMTSAGGLVDADSFVGKDSILSGPAGGVIGFSQIARQAGFEKSIGFDMGGTSTDVSRFDGRYELEFETQKAGVRIVSPMLAIETVAAGGGSVCGFDGVKLFVGPQSAGADPGPACYGRGGPLTVTDVNLFLGRILPEHFPFTLNTAVVGTKLKRLCEEIAGSPLGREYSPVGLAEGFREIANASMVRAIRKISVAKGYDPSDYALVAFGGAGGQHACAIAAQLGVSSVLIHPLAGILSAYGIGQADVRRFAEQAVLKPFSPELLAELELTFDELEQRPLAEVRAEGIPEERIDAPVRSLDLRYAGVESTINVAWPMNRDFRAAYETEHERLYGYCHESRPLEVVAARVEVTGRSTVTHAAEHESTPRSVRADEHAAAFFNRVATNVAVFRRGELKSGDSFQGPAIVCEPTSTVVIDPGFEATILSRGEILIEELPEEASTTANSERNGDESRRREREDDSDPVLLEIFNNLFASIAEQMGVTLQRTSLSTNVKERLDFSCAIFTSTGDLVVNAPHIPVHLGAMSETVRHLLADVPDIGPGDVYVTNDPFRGGSHLPDVTVVTPVHDTDSGELIFLTASRAHHSEIGGIVPGSMPPFSKNLGEEGVLIRCFRLVENGRSNEAGLRELLSADPLPSRSVDNNIADIAAQVAANNSGVQLLRELVERYSLSVVHAQMRHIQRAASEKMRLALSRIPDGLYERTDHLDDGSPIHASIEIRGDSARVDFTGTGPVLTDSNLNANRAIVTAAVLYVFRCLIDEDIPLNSGVLEPVSIVLPECLLNPPSSDIPAECVAVVGGNVETSQRVVDVLLGALGVAAASQGTMNNLTFGDSSFGYYETICGGSGATRDAPGTDAVHTHMTNTRLTDVEVIERRYPVRIHEFSIRRGSGGAGRQRGGDGIVRRIEFLKPLSLSLLSERRGEFSPFGLQGGQHGQVGRNALLRAGESECEELTGKVQLDVGTGDILTIETPGGGAFGREREEAENETNSHKE
jgi:5-oxoprolinase (ATP-hydrolysing)